MRLALSCAVILAAGSCFAQPGVTYPKVYGPTGSLYGPTQAHYQYERQYGRAWVSPSGRSVRVDPNGGGGYTYQAPSHVPQVPVVPYGYGPYAAGYRGVHVHTPFVNVGVGVGFGRSVVLNVPGIVGFRSGYPYGSGITAIGVDPYGYSYTAPVSPFLYDPIAAGDPIGLDNTAMARARLEEQQCWQQPLAVEPVVGRPRPLVERSSRDMILRSVTHRTDGDRWFQKLRFSTAFDKYKAAIRAAGELPDSHLRAGFALVAMGKPSLAASYFERAVELAPELPQTGMPLEDLFGVENALVRSSTILKTSAWVREDIRDPERLFVLGVMLHFDQQQDTAAEFFEAALRLRGQGDHLTAFLSPAEVVAAPEPEPTVVQPKVIEIPQHEESPVGPELPLPFPEP